MTLIAKTTRKGFPFLISDILFTSKEGRKNLVVPIDTGDAQLYIEVMENKPEFHAQKLHILTPDFAIAMAGDYYEMRDFIRDLRIHVGYYDKIDTTVVDKILKDLDAYDRLKESSFLICLTERNGSAIKSFTRTHPQNTFTEGKSARFESIIACGSGASDFLEFNEEEGNFDPYPEGLDHTFVCNVEMLARIMANDVATLENLNNAWGSGFEVAYCTRTGFHKANNLAYVVMSGTKQEDGKFKLVPQKVFHVKYEDDNLIYSCLDFKEYQLTADNTSLHYVNIRTKNSLYIVEPIDAVRTEAPDAKYLAFKTNQVAVGFAVKNLDESFDIDGTFILGGTNILTYDGRGILTFSIPVSVFFQIANKHMNSQSNS